MERKRKVSAVFRYRRAVALVGVALLAIAMAAARSKTANQQLAAIIVDYPKDGSVFPPEITAPTFIWHDAAEHVAVWQVKVTFAGKGRPMSLDSHGEKPQVGEIDESYAGFEPPALTAEEETAHTWKPDDRTWAEIKRRSAKSAATVTVTGFGDERRAEPVSQGRVVIRTSADPAGAPIFFRDVPLVRNTPSTEDRGTIKPLPDSAVPEIKWRLRYLNEARSRTVMQGVPTCINCHSFSRDGKTMGLDVDGPMNDKGLYGLVPVEKNTTIDNGHVIRWSEFTEEGSPKRFGFMSQISPDGNYVVTSVEPKAWRKGRTERLFNAAYINYGFSQVFYPTEGVLTWYSKETGKLQPLPGADDPEYVQTSAFWSPDGKYLVFSRAKAKSAYEPNQQMPTYANDPKETQIQYDLYRIPFNGGKGGTPERVIGASENGMSNDFPKVSPDGKWIVWVQNKNGLLMRPDSKLYIVPFEGGEPRPLASNLPVMNSWHSFSPNGRWLVFSSKPPTFYTRLYLTHVDEEGNTTPAIWIEGATAANRAANIPEFLNIGTTPGGLERIDPAATEFYRLYNVAAALEEKNQYEKSVAAWQKAMELDAEDPRAHRHLGVALAASGRLNEAVGEFQRSIQLEPGSSTARENFGIALARLGRLDEAIEQMQKAAELNPNDAGTHSNLCGAFAQSERMNEAIVQCQAAIQLDPSLADAYNNLGFALSATNRLDEAADSLRRAVQLDPNSAEYRNNLRRVLAMQAGSTKH
jgi:Flp pilus assembly protein TadD